MSGLRIVTVKELKVILAKPRAWLEGDEAGERMAKALGWKLEPDTE